MRDKKYVLMSIKPIYAELIKSGKKTIELRRIAPKVNSGDVLVIYESAPVKRITSYCEIDAVIIAEPTQLWEIACDSAGVTLDSFTDYFKGKMYAVGIKLGIPQILSASKELSEVSADLQAPQSYRYLTQDQFKKITK